MLMPRKVAHRKQHRGRMRGTAKGGTEVIFGEYGIQALEPGWITARQIEAARIAMTRHIKRGGKVWINVFPDKPVTEKPAETRMGSGKGNPEHWVAVVKPGRVLFELSYPDADVARAAIDRAIQKLPIKARFVTTRKRRSDATWPKTSFRDLDDDALVDQARRGEGRAVQAALPARHRPARQPRRSARCAATSPASTPSSGPARSRPPRGSPRRTRDGRDHHRPQRAARKVREGVVASTPWTRPPSSS